MTRKEERIQAANHYKTFFPDGFINEFTYIDGAEWADENPDERMIAKYLHEKKGYPIDLNGNLPSFEETMKDTEQYIKYKEKKLIDKACEFLIKHLRNDNDGHGYPTISIDSFSFLEELVEDFKLSMEM